MPDQPPLPGDSELDDLLLTEVAARAAIKLARDEAAAAFQKWQEAALLLEEAVVPPGFTRPTAEEVQKLFQEFRAARLKAMQLYAGHVALYEQFLGKYPHNWRGHHKLAWFYADFNDLLNAADQWRQTIVLRPDFPYAYNNLGTVYNHLGRDMESIDLYLKAISLLDDEPEYHFNLATVLATHRFEVAQKFTWALPQVFQQSQKHFRTARDLAPKNFEYAEAAATQFVLARHFELKDWADEAIQDWQFCLKMPLDKQQRARMLTGLARIYLREKKDPAKARQLLLEAKQLEDNPTLDTLLKETERTAEGQREQ